MVSAPLMVQTIGFLLLPCSTPYGINGFGTLRLVFDSEGLGVVLNALRHQWFRHSVTRVIFDEAGLCSTPYGINGFGTL